MSKRKGKEKSNLFDYQVSCFGRHGTVTVSLPSTISTSIEIKQALWKVIGLKPSSMPCFSLFLGPLGAPRRKYMDMEPVRQIDPLCLQKWGADMKLEEKATRMDAEAIHLLYSEAIQYLKNGRMKPSEEQRAALEEYMDPSFPTERQFLDCARNIDGYVGVDGRECLLKTDFEHEGVTVPGGNVNCFVTSSHMSICTLDGQHKAQWPWSQVKRWSKLEPYLHTVQFEVIMAKATTGILEWVSMETSQATLLLQGAMDVCLHLRDSSMTQEEVTRKLENTVEGKLFDPLHEYLQNVLFGVGPKFSSSVTKD